MTKKLDPNDLMTPTDAALVLGVSADSVRTYADTDKLPCLRTVTGRRLFKRSDVEALRVQRETKS
jgi:excisionase family DNA binding protein